MFVKTTLNSRIHYQNHAPQTNESINRTLHLFYDIKWYHINTEKEIEKTKSTANHLVNSALTPFEKRFVGMTGLHPYPTNI